MKQLCIPWGTSNCPAFVWQITELPRSKSENTMASTSVWDAAKNKERPNVPALDLGGLVGKVCLPPAPIARSCRFVWVAGGQAREGTSTTTTTTAADSHTTRRKHQHQPNTQRPGWGPDPPHRHFTHTQPPPPANKARAQTSKAGPGGSDSAPPMGRRPYPSASEVTRTRPRQGAALAG